MSSNQPTTKLMVLMFTDLAGSVDLKTRLGAPVYAGLISRHDALFKQVMASIPHSQTIKDTGDGFLARFETASDAVRAALCFQYMLKQEPWVPEPVGVRIGLHIGQVTELDREAATGLPKLVGLAADIAARVMDLATPGQILMTRTLFDDARQFLREHPTLGGEDQPMPQIKWMAHGPYLFKGSDEPMDVFEVGAIGIAPLQEPPDSAKARRAVRPGEESLFGWRPAIGLPIPGRDGWLLEQKLGEGGFGEVWLARQQRTKDARVFKFCFDADRLRSFKREMTLFRLLREALGDRRDIAKLWEVRLDEPPYYLESAFTREGDLTAWSNRIGGISTLPLAVRIELLASIADAVAAAHSVGVLHKDIKPSNVLIEVESDGTPRPLLADFGIGMISDPSQLHGRNITVTGFTETVMGNESSRTGTRMYSPPEMLSGQAFTTKGDVFALGVMLYQLVVGDLARPLAHGWERDIEDPLLREDIAAAVAGDVNNRIAGASELADRLRRLPQRRAERTRQRRLRMASMVAVMLALLLVVSGGLIWRERGLREEANEQRRLAVAAQGKSEQQREEIAALFRENQNRLVRLYVEKGWAPGINIRHSLLWFTEALKHAPADEASQRIHRLRIASVLHHLPRLQHEYHVGTGTAIRGISHDGRLIVVHRSDLQMEICDVLTGERTLLKSGPVEYIGRADFSRDATRVALSGDPIVTRIWDTRTGLSASTPLAPADGAREIRFGANDSLIIVTGVDGAARIHDATSGSLVARLEGQKNDLKSAHLSPDGSTLVTVDLQGGARLWRVADQTLVAQLQHDEGVTCVHFAPDSARVATGGVDKNVRVWDVSTGLSVLPPMVHPESVIDLAFDPQGTKLAAISFNSVCLWNTTTGDPLMVPRLLAGTPHSVQFSPDGLSFAVDMHGGLQVSDSHTGKPRCSPIDQQVEPLTARWVSPTKLTVVRKVGVVHHWDIGSVGQPQARLSHSVPAAGDDDPRAADELNRGIDGRFTIPNAFKNSTRPGWNTTKLVVGGEFSRDGSKILTFGWDNTVRGWNSDGSPLFTPIANSYPVRAVGFLPEGKRFFAVTSDGKIQIYDLASGKPTSAPLQVPAPVDEVVISPTAHRLITIVRWKSITLSDLSANARIGEPLDADNRDADVLFYPDGEQILVKPSDRKAQVYQASDFRHIEVSSFDPSVFILAFTDGGRKAIGCEDRRFLILDTVTGAVESAIAAPLLYSHHVHASGGGRLMIGSRIYDMKTGQPVTPAMKVEGPRTRAFSHDGTLVATGDDEMTARVWDASTGEAITPPLVHPAIVHHVSFSPDDRTLLTVAGDSAYLWKIVPDRRPLEKIVRGTQIYTASTIDETGSVVQHELDVLQQLSEQSRADK